ncbi:2364_t:CDS:2 [Acaulospora colombiana]|uniref:2364_t:CDS:1 n=1 Tax=Acaulospora colombiana TaxID=27376 RepID=A0ACA9LA63_9GLOM|nr:2364_t:CDS:2 [Acaulospora colombiana]
MKTQISKTVDSVGAVEMEHRISDSASDYKDSQMGNEYDATTNREKVLGTLSGMSMNINNMIGSAIFSATGDIWFLTGSGGMTLLLYVIGFVYSLVGSFIYVELDSSIPESDTLDEMKDPEKRLKISNPISVLVVGVLYILAVLSIIVVVDPSAGHEDAYNQVISTQLGNEIGLGGLVSVLIAVSSIGAVGSMVWSGSRIVAAAATKDYIPFFSPKLREFHEKFNTPFNALIFQWIYCSVIVLFFPSNNPTMHSQT